MPPVSIASSFVEAFDNFKVGLDATPQNAQWTAGNEQRVNVMVEWSSMASPDREAYIVQLAERFTADPAAGFAAGFRPDYGVPQRSKEIGAHAGAVARCSEHDAWLRGVAMKIMGPTGWEIMPLIGGGGVFTIV